MYGHCVRRDTSRGGYYTEIPLVHIVLLFYAVNQLRFIDFNFTFYVFKVL